MSKNLRGKKSKTVTLEDSLPNDLTAPCEKPHAKENIKVAEPETVQEQYVDEIHVPKKVKSLKSNHLNILCKLIFVQHVKNHMLKKSKSLKSMHLKILCKMILVQHVKNHKLNKKLK